MDTIKVGTSQNIAIDYPVAGLGERIAARLIDLAVFFVIYISFIILSLATGIAQLGIVFSVLLWTYFACYVFYNLICEIFVNGQSIGKRIMKIKVISLDGAQPSLGQYFIRWIFRLVDFLFTVQVGGLVSVAVTENKQRIGDIIAGTTVIKTVPRTKIDHIAFNPAESDQSYAPTFLGVQELSDRDIELIHEVIITYYKTRNYDLIEAMTRKIAEHIGVAKPSEMSGIDFLHTVIQDYNHLTSAAI